MFPCLLINMGMNSARSSLLYKKGERGNTMSYNYSHWVVNGIELHVIYGPASDVTIRKITDNVTDTSFISINGGFLDLNNINSILSIAVNNDVPVGGSPYQYSVGWYNIGGPNHNYNAIPKGAFVYNGDHDSLSVQIVAGVENLSVSNRNYYWAQGGVSMSLGKEAKWEKIAQDQELPSMNISTMRAGLCYVNKNVYLIVTNDNGTAGAFRKAIKDNFSFTDGIFLDGSGSSQLRCYNIT